jgi:hypothetical protein
MPDLWAGYVALMGDRRGAYRLLVGRDEGRVHLEDLGVDGRKERKVNIYGFNVA